MIEVAMQRFNLEVEASPFAPPLKLRPFQVGDEETWLRLQRSTGVYGELEDGIFRREFGEDLGDRQLFLMDGSLAIATGTAWHGSPLRGSEWGRLHWVAVNPAYQRRGLGSKLCKHLLSKLRQFGFRSAFLTTGSENRVAIGLYRTLGFEPWIRSHEEALFWKAYLASHG
ncbi:MAG: GNAT family N-acetyltransferase [Candidatus Eisenbacteria bacterium]|nr:GNAT family N-acetyltransferase [Candidatus Eisenbacteria bacterium]